MALENKPEYYARIDRVHNACRISATNVDLDRVCFPE